MVSYRFCLASALEKIFPNAAPAPLEEPLEAFCGETASFQIAFYLDCGGEALLEDTDAIFFSAHAEGCAVRLRAVALVPGGVVCSGAHDGDYLTTRPGLFPDPLEPMPENGVLGAHRQWRAVWVDVTPGPDCPAGPARVAVTVKNASGRALWTAWAELTVFGGTLPELSLLHTEMLHADCLADYYRVEPFSARHWSILERYIRYAVQHGVNMILTPLFTPPTDTAVGGERTTVQLVGVERSGGVYAFDFSRLDRWIDLCLSCGARYLEMAPLFTQWGAAYAPKILARVDGGERRIFGWDTPAQGEAYREFLNVFLPALRAHLAGRGVLGRTWFHVSDEPTERNLTSYAAAQRLMARHLPDSPLFDACSDYALYEKGAVRRPVVSSDHIEPFLEARVPNLWTYYCCVQGVDVSNRFFAMPPQRCRIIGVQAYLYRLEGFLHWGYNFYNTRFSKKHIDPYAVTDCGGAFPAGDAFLVYPGEDGAPRGSIRLMMLSQAMNDHRALCLLERLTSFDFVRDCVDEQAGMRITFRQYPRGRDFLPALRRRVNAEIAQRLGKV